MGGKSKTKSSNTQTLNPESRRNIQQGQANIRGLVNNNPFQSYDGDMVAGLNDTQLRARDMFGDNMNTGQGLLDQAASMAEQAGGYTPERIEAQSFAEADLSQYMNPFQQEVIDAAANDINRHRDLSLNDNKTRAAHAGAFGGSRHGVIDAETNRAAGDTLARTTAQLRSDGFDRAAGLFGQDANRHMQADMANNQFGLAGASKDLAAAGLFGNLGNAANANARADAATMGAFGSEENDIDTARLQAAYQDFLRGYEDPFRRAGVEAMATGLMPALVNSTGTSTQRQTPGIGSLVGTGLQAAALFSDRNLKHDIKPVGTHKGRKWYEFKYIFDPLQRVFTGLMAQDLLESEPERVTRHESGFYMVNYEGVV
jgi:hypothetical protein